MFRNLENKKYKTILNKTKPCITSDWFPVSLPLVSIEHKLCINTSTQLMVLHKIFIFCYGMEIQDGLYQSFNI
jgi:hypothetical protein